MNKLTQYAFAGALAFSSTSAANASTEYCNLPVSVTTQYIKKAPSKPKMGIVYLIPTVAHEKPFENTFRKISELAYSKSIKTVIFPDEARDIVSLRGYFLNKQSLAQLVNETDVLFYGSMAKAPHDKVGGLRLLHLESNFIQLYDRTQEQLEKIDARSKTSHAASLAGIISREVEYFRPLVKESLQRDGLADYSWETISPIIHGLRKEQALESVEMIRRANMKTQALLWNNDTDAFSQLIADAGFEVCIAPKESSFPWKELFWQNVSGKAGNNAVHGGLLVWMQMIARYHADIIDMEGMTFDKGSGTYKFSEKKADTDAFLEPYLRSYFENR